MPKLLSSQNPLRLVSGPKLPRSPAPAPQALDSDGVEGLVALLVTDLVGFTASVELLGDAEARAWIRKHNRLVRACVGRRCGREVAHTGDGLIAVFRSVTAALTCASEVQETLAMDPSPPRSIPLSARIGVHVGEPLHEEERLFGHCVNTTVRVCTEARAGSVLVTEVVRQLAEARFRFAVAGLRQLKGISQPLPLYELVGIRP